jgi:hypothetical protein
MGRFNARMFGLPRHIIGRLPFEGVWRPLFCGYVAIQLPNRDKISREFEEEIR